MWGRIMEWTGDFQKKYGEGSPADLDWGKLVILGLHLQVQDEEALLMQQQLVILMQKANLTP